MLKVGLVGLGGISKVHLDAYRELECVKLVAAADVQGEDAPRYDIAKELGAKVYGSLGEMLDAEELDMLDICTPTPCHKEMVLEGLSRGLHVLSEKPMSRTYDDCCELVAAAQASGKKYMVAHVVRFMKPYAYLRSVIETGELGKPVHIIMRRLSPVPRWSYRDWLVDTAQSGGVPLDLSIHDLDFVYSVFGEPKDVRATYRSYRGKGGFGLNDYICSELIYDDMSVSVTGAQYNADPPFAAEFSAFFENGFIELKGGKLYRCGEEVVLEETVKSEATGINISSSSAYTDEIAYFAGCIERDEAPVFVTTESSAGSVKLVERLLAVAVKI